MDLSKNNPADQEPQQEHAGPDYLPPQEGFTPPSEPQVLPGYGTHPQQSQNPSYGSQPYPTEQYPNHPVNSPYGYQQAPQNYPAPPAYPGHQNQQPYPPQNGYGQPQYYAAQPGYPQPYGYPGVQTEGEKLAKESWILGLVGLFILGVLLGGIGLYKAFKAQALGANATAGFILSSLAIAGHLFWMFVFFIGMVDSPSRY